MDQKTASTGDNAARVMLRYIFLIPLAYVFALFCGAMTMAVAIVGITDEVSAAAALGVTIAFTLFGGMITFLPALAFIILAEAFGWRSIVAYLAAGGVIGLLAAETTNAFGGLEGAEHLRLISIAGGFVGGLVYWLIAGKLAGGRPGRTQA